MFWQDFLLTFTPAIKKNIMNNSKGWKTDHSACILEEQRLHVYRWMLREILNGNTRGEFLCHLLDDYNEKHKTCYSLNQFPELVMQKHDFFVWWTQGEGGYEYEWLGDMAHFKNRMKLRSYILSDAIEFLSF